ncbi:MAG: ATPase [Bacteroidales bacterium]|nr:ATPase [Bacteroidales bacterium]MCF8402362.1 ATPase [Bacteroidales bacterium]
MKKTIAIPLIDGKFCSHFGHCNKFAIIETKNNIVQQTQLVDPPVHKHGAFPSFMAEKGVDVVIGGGMGVKAQELLRKNNIEIILGVSNGDPEELAKSYLAGALKSYPNLCDH